MLLKSADVSVPSIRSECFYHLGRFCCRFHNTSVHLIFQLTPHLLDGGIKAPLPIWNVLPEELLPTAQQQQQQQRQQQHHFLDYEAVAAIFWRHLPGRQTGVSAPLHVSQTGMSERLEKERQRGIVGQAGSQAAGLYKDKSFPWNKKKKKEG